MNPASILQAEIMAAFKPGRKALLRMGLTLLLGLPFVLIDMPPKVKGGGLTMLILFHGFFGAAVGWVRARAEGRLTWQALWPGAAWQRARQRILAGAWVDFVQSLPLLILFVLINAPSAGLNGLCMLFIWYAASLLVLNLLGAGLGRLAGSNAEVHLFGALGVCIIAVASGLFPLPQSIAGIVGAIAPYSPVHGLAMVLCSGGLDYAAPPAALALALALAGISLLLLAPEIVSAVRHRAQPEE
jgi:hypothetical protein